jgi:glycosyltransferase involved in cell wall biosynthesis
MEPGVSRARNRAANEATFDYVAYVDDDIWVASDWLPALNATIEEHGALVVGGRIEEVYENGFAPPSWLDCRYLKGFFRIEYDGRRPPVFRVRPPDYIGAANSAYARKLFAEFDGFPTHFGPKGTKRLRGSETYFNLMLERAGVPIYYTDHAVAHHLVTARQVSRRSLLRASYLQGIEWARIDSDGIPARAVLRLMIQRVRELPGLVLVRSLRDVKFFCRFCQVIRNIRFILETWRLLTTRLFRSATRGEQPPPPA